MTDEVIGELASIEKKIGQHETQSILARWEFGHLLIQQRVGKQLPRGLRDRVREEFDLEASEITRRMQLAVEFATREELNAACDRCGGSWRLVIREELTKTARPSKPADFGQRAEWRIKKWIADVGDDRELRAELVKALTKALDELTAADLEDVA